MKNNHLRSTQWLVAGVLSLALCACQKALFRPAGQATVSISLALPGETRTTGASSIGESRINTLQVFIFNPDGSLESSASSSADTVRLRCRYGAKTIWAIANAPDLSAVTTLGALAASVSRLDDNAPASLVMAGDRSLTIDSDRSVSIPVSRLCAKIVVGKITKAFTSGILQGKRLTLRRIYLTNVAGDRTFESGGTVSLWYNRLGYQGECDALLCDPVGRDVDPVLEETHVFYVYPNASESAARGAPWTPRCTRLVLEAELEGETCYYVIDLPGLESNHSYVLSDLVLTRPGAGDEESVTAASGVRFSFSVRSWTEADPYNEVL